MVMRTKGGEELFNKICEAFDGKISKSIWMFMGYNEERLTGLQKTQSIDKFYGVSDRGASINLSNS